MKIIGIDPGLVKTGFGIIEIVNKKKQVIDYGIIKPDSKSTLSNRLHTIYKDTKNIIPPLYGALLKNEQDVHLFEKLAFLNLQEKR